MLLPSNAEVLTIGIFGSNGKSSTMNLLSSIFTGSGLIVSTIGNEKNVVHNRSMANNEVYKKLKNMEKSDIILVKIDEEFLKCISPDIINFDILIHCRICESSYEGTKQGIGRINKIINSSEKIKTVILNTDDMSWKKILVNLENSYLITYGLGTKATVTASSIECSKEIKFCYCLQRTLTNFKKEKIEPMEEPIILKAPGQHNVYNGLAAITASLVYGISIDNIKYSLSSNNGLIGGLRVLYEDGFSVVDNICKNIVSFETGFESVQNLPYENVILVFNLDNRNTHNVDKKILDTIVTWSLTLKMKNVYCINSSNPFCDTLYFNKFRKDLNNSEVTVINKTDALLNVENIINSLREKDLLLFFCSSEMDEVREKIVDLLDKRILGSLSGDIA